MLRIQVITLFVLFNSNFEYLKLDLTKRLLTLLNKLCFVTENNITVVATGVSTGNDVAMPPHIQILSSDPNEQQQHHVPIQDS